MNNNNSNSNNNSDNNNHIENSLFSLPENLQQQSHQYQHPMLNTAAATRTAPTLNNSYSFSSNAFTEHQHQYNASLPEVSSASGNFQSVGGPNQHVPLNVGLGSRASLETFPPYQPELSSLLTQNYSPAPFVQISTSAPSLSAMASATGAIYNNIYSDTNLTNQMTLSTSLAQMMQSNFSTNKHCNQHFKDSSMSETSSRKTASAARTSRKRLRDGNSVRDDENDRVKRRKDRNLREQQRSHQISSQIDRLRDILSEVKAPFKPDKFSILSTTGQFIRQLQERSSSLNSEHRKLLDTISKTSEIVNNQYVSVTANFDPTPRVVSQGSGGNDTSQDMYAGSQATISESTVVDNSLDHKSIFSFCPVACAITSIDGRFLDCNRTFEEVSGFCKLDLIPIENNYDHKNDVDHPATTSQPTRRLSLFNILQRSDMERVYSSMSSILKKQYGKPPAAQSSVLSTITPTESSCDYFSDVVGLSRQNHEKITLNVSLVRTPTGQPKYFTCTIVPIMTTTSKNSEKGTTSSTESSLNCSDFGLLDSDGGTDQNVDYEDLFAT